VPAAACIAAHASRVTPPGRGALAMCLLYDVCGQARALRLCRSSAAAGSAYGLFALGYAHQ
jgi:hypothetical protein